MAILKRVKGEEGLIDVLAHYDLGAFRGCRRVEHGYVNETWNVETTRGRYILKRRCPDLCETHRIAGQHALVRHLCAAGFPAPQFVPARSGATFVEVDCDVYEVQEYVAGGLCDPGRPTHVATAARTLGRYHCAVDGFDHPAFHKGRACYGTRMLEGILDGLKVDWEGKLGPELAGPYKALLQHADDLRARFRGFGPLSELVIHGDFYAENLIFRGDAIAGVVDYDQANWCARVLEVAEALLYFAREANARFHHIVYPGILDLDKVARFLGAYAEIVRLSDAEICALPHWMRIIWMCASLNPPLKPRLGVEKAGRALPEVLALADWASVHAPHITRIGFDVRMRQAVL